jgi:glycosyltransferase involved in cell wall biosynthesis
MSDMNRRYDNRCALFFHPEAYSVPEVRLMGRNVAGQSFLRGFLENSRASAFPVYCKKIEHAHIFAQIVRNSGRSETVKFISKETFGALSQVGLLYLPGPGLGEQAWRRAAYGHASWSLCGITHTTSSARAMDALVDLILAPVQPWDALICTSNAVKDNVQRVLQAEVEYLKDRLGIGKLVLPRLPVIPLGIHTHDFNFTDNDRELARAELGIGEDTLVVLFMGRLSFHAKAHPLAMYQALEDAGRQTGKDVVLIECGWHANEFIAEAFISGAKAACPSVRVLTLDGRKESDRKKAWSSADIFCSLSDNVQETFGITPIEAMAAGLPVVVSDWDGYRDTVRNEIDGFRIQTIMPPDRLGSDLALRHALELDTYDMYCGHTSSLVAVDVQETTQAFVKLFSSKDLRRRMGEEGRARARQVFDWSVIIPQYEELWNELADIRNEHANDLKPLAHPWPARIDPFYSFESYPSSILGLEAIIELVDPDAHLALKRTLAYSQLKMVNYAKFIFLENDEIVALINFVSQKPITLGSLLVVFPEERRPFVFRSIGWFLKLGIFKLGK